MGIDPVTHSPRLDLLDLSSILSSSLYNSSHHQMNMTRFLGVQPVVNPELLKLATSLMSSSQRGSNQNSFFFQNSHEVDQNQLCGTINNNSPQIQELVQPNQLQEISAGCPTLDIPCVPLSNDHQGHHDLSNLTNFSSPSSQISEWQSSTTATTTGMPSNFSEDYVPNLPCYSVYNNFGHDHHHHHHQTTVIDPCSTESFQSNNSNQNFSFTTSVLSTPSSSPTTNLNSNSTTYLNSGTEDERESYCSSILKFDISDILDVNEFM